MLTHLYHKNAQKTSTRLLILCLAYFFLFSQGAVVEARKPDDPYLSQWSYADTKVYEAWDKATGNRNVVVAIIDNGFDMYHPDLHDNTWKNEDEIADNGLDDDGNGYIDDVWGWNFVPEDINGNGAVDESEYFGNNDPRPPVIAQNGEDLEAVHHGTLVAGIVGAVGNNGNDSAGINWRVRLMNIKVLGNSGIGNVAHMARAIRYAVDNGAHVINFSLVADEDIGLSEAITYAYEHGVAVVAAVGNNGMTLKSFPKYPACVDGVGEQRILGVSAIDESHQLAFFSNFGSSCIDITAPGVGIASTVRYAPAYGLAKTYDYGWQGTSFATPFVSGAAALVKSIRPEWGAKEIYDALLKNVHKTPPIDEAAYASRFGFGLLQIDKVVAYALSGAPVNLRVVDMVTRGAYSLNPNSDVISKLEQPVPLFDDVAILERQGGYNHVGIKQKDKKTSIVSLYSPTWELIKTWQVSTAGLSTIMTGDVHDQPGNEIILVPRYGDTTVYRVFAEDGTLIRTVKAKLKHAGVQASVVHAPDMDQIVALFLQGKNTELNQYDKTGAVIVTIALAGSAAKDKPFAADINTDGVFEFVRVSPKSLVTVMEHTGAMILSFSGYADAGKNGVTAWVGDADHDGSPDIALSRVDGSGPVRLFSAVGRKMREWQLPLTGQKNIRLFAE